jgi:hypothetical protein
MEEKLMEQEAELSALQGNLLVKDQGEYFW